VTVETPTVLPMPEADRPAAVAVLAQWLAEVLADESFQHASPNAVTTAEAPDQAACPLPRSRAFVVGPRPTGLGPTT
jgi:hypothetical protein